MLRSPIYHVLARSCYIDLSQLAEVGPVSGGWIDALDFTSFDNQDPMYWPGFSYRFSTSAESISYRRPLRRGPDRLSSLDLVNPSDALKCLGEEYFEIVQANSKFPNHRQTVGKVLVVHDRTDRPAYLRHLEAERLRLINAWQKWKAAEPEIYAIIRKHLT